MCKYARVCREVSSIGGEEMNIFSGLFKVEFKLLLTQPISMVFGVAAPILFFSILLLDFLMCYFIGLFLGSVFKDPKVSQTVAMIVYFEFVFLGGFTFPIEIMPKFMQTIAYIMPTTHAVKVLQFAWNGTDLLAGYHLLVVAITTFIFGVLEEHNAKLRILDDTLAKVLTRASHKTSPFSTLTNVGIGLWKDNFENNKEENPSLLFSKFNQAYLLRLFEILLWEPVIMENNSYHFADMHRELL